MATATHVDAFFRTELGKPSDAYVFVMQGNLRRRVNAPRYGYSDSVNRDDDGLQVCKTEIGRRQIASSPSLHLRPKEAERSGPLSNLPELDEAFENAKKYNKTDAWEDRAVYRFGMAAKKKINKTQFVKALPKDMTAKDVVRKAKESGITIFEAYVYTIRSAASRAGAGAGKSAAPAAKKAAVTAAAPAAKVAAKAKKAAGKVGKVGKSAKVATPGAHVASGMHAAPIMHAVHVGSSSKIAKASKKAGKKSEKKSGSNGHSLGTSAAHASPSGSAERRFVELVADIGMRRAEIFLQQFRGQVGHIKVG